MGESFQEGRESVQDHERPGKPVTETSPANVKRVRSLIENNHALSVSDLEELTSLSFSTILRIFHDHLGLRKVSSRWTPHFLTPENKARRLDFATTNSGSKKPVQEEDNVLYLHTNY